MRDAGMKDRGGVPTTQNRAVLFVQPPNGLFRDYLLGQIKKNARERELPLCLPPPSSIIGNVEKSTDTAMP
jgi:hypothetical protein